MKNELRNAITNIANRMLEDEQSVTVSSVKAAVEGECQDVLINYGLMLQEKGMLAIIKDILKRMADPEEKRQESQLSLPGMAAPSVITNSVDGSQDKFVYIRLDKATEPELVNYRDVLALNAANVLERLKDLDIKIEYLRDAFELMPGCTVAEACDFAQTQQVKSGPHKQSGNTAHDSRP
jgi:hypothetical protein